jgi:iron complex outermembrane recepter protein
MSRSRRRKLLRLQARPKRAATVGSVPMAAMLAMSPFAAAQDRTEQPAQLEEVIVTAQKRTESLQDVPLSITALGNERLESLRLTDFDDIARFLPSLSYITAGPGFSRVYFRGVASGDIGNHSGSQPSVAVYLDEQPITTIQGALDLHLYDIARVEALAGPQGTLYGASSQAGTVRYITNKPVIGEFESGYDIEGSILRGEGGGVAEGFVNIPVSDNAAIRLVGWAKQEPGYIDNASGTLTYPTAGVTISNGARAKDNYNDVTTFGARALLKIDLNDSWTVTPALMAQQQKANGAFSFDPTVGDLKVNRFRPERSKDKFAQAALTLEGKFANLDLVYAGAYLRRNDRLDQDYTDYSFFYDQLFGYVVYNDNGDVIEPTQYIQGRDRYRRWTQEVRLSSAGEGPLRWVGGLFAQRQQHGIEQRYRIDGLTSDYEVTGWADTIWLTEQTRVDRDFAVFSELTYAFTDKLSGTIGARWFKSNNSLRGYFGYTDGYSTSGRNGEALCSLLVGSPIGDRSNWRPFTGISAAPCLNLDDRQKEDGVTPKYNLTYHIDDDRMVYATVSKGFRPGGVNRNPILPPYDADFLQNYEIGWKSSWADNSLRFNGALFWQDWKNYQYSFLGPNGLTLLTNAGQARIKGVEADIEWLATDGFTLTGSMTILDSKLTKDFCEELDTATGNPLPPAQCAAQDTTPKGTRLPLSARFKANLTGRYEFPIGAFEGHVQASLSHEGERRSALVPGDEVLLGGPNAAYQIADISFGIKTDKYSAVLFVNNVTDERASIARFSQCDESVCSKPYIVTNLPRTVGIKFTQRF